MIRPVVRGLLAFAALVALSACSFAIPIGERDSGRSGETIEFRPSKSFYEPGYTFRHDENRLLVYGYDAMNAVDIQQTMRASRRPECFSEVDPVTRALVGEHPSPASAAGVLLLGGVVTYYASAFLDSRDVPDENGETNWAGASRAMRSSGSRSRARRTRSTRTTVRSRSRALRRGRRRARDAVSPRGGRGPPTDAGALVPGGQTMPSVIAFRTARVRSRVPSFERISDT